MDESIKHRIKQQYNRLSALLVFIANAFTLMYVGGMQYNDALWFGSVSGAFTYTILSTIADSQDLEDMIPERRKKTATYQVPNQAIPPNMIPYQQYQQIWIPDDDLQIQVEDVNKIFKIADHNHMNLSQPSLRIPNYDPEELQRVLKLVVKPIDEMRIVDLYDLRSKHPKENKIINKTIEFFLRNDL